VISTNKKISTNGGTRGRIPGWPKRGIHSNQFIKRRQIINSKYPTIVGFNKYADIINIFQLKIIIHQHISAKDYNPSNSEVPLGFVKDYIPTAIPNVTKDPSNSEIIRSNKIYRSIGTQISFSNSGINNSNHDQYSNRLDYFNVNPDIAAHSNNISTNKSHENPVETTNIFYSDDNSNNSQNTINITHHSSSHQIPNDHNNHILSNSNNSQIVPIPYLNVSPTFPLHQPSLSYSFSPISNAVITSVSNHSDNITHNPTLSYNANHNQSTVHKEFPIY